MQRWSSARARDRRFDIDHVVRNAVRRIAMDDDLTVLIGPATDGRLLEIGVPDLAGNDPVVIQAMALRAKFFPILR